VRSFVGEGNWNLRASGEGVVKEWRRGWGKRR